MFFGLYQFWDVNTRQYFENRNSEFQDAPRSKADDFGHALGSQKAEERDIEKCIEHQHFCGRSQRVPLDSLSMQLESRGSGLRAHADSMQEHVLASLLPDVGPGGLSLEDWSKIDPFVCDGLLGSLQIWWGCG